MLALFHCSAELINYFPMRRLTHYFSRLMVLRSQACWIVLKQLQRLLELDLLEC